MKPAIEWLRHLLATQAPRLDLEIDPGQETVVSAQYGRRRLLILSHSEEYWTFIPASQADQLFAVAWAHTSCLPCPVLSLEDGYTYAPYEFPRGFDLWSKLTKKNSRIFLGCLLAGVQEAYDRLAVMPRSSRARYISRLNAAIIRRGRPRRAA